MNKQEKIDLKAAVSDKKAILFDLDGTILNSEPLHQKAIEILLQKVGQSFDTNSLDLDKFIGVPDQTVYREIPILNNNFSLREYLVQKNQILVELIQGLDQQYFLSLFTKDFFTFLAHLKSIQKKVAIVTASEENVLMATVRRAKIEEQIDYLCPREENFGQKPKASPYLSALRKFSILSKEALVFEDSETGIQAASEAGIDFIQVDLNDKNRPITISSFSF